MDPSNKTRTSVSLSPKHSLTPLLEFLLAPETIEIIIGISLCGEWHTLTQDVCSHGECPIVVRSGHVGLHTEPSLRIRI